MACWACQPPTGAGLPVTKSPLRRAFYGRQRDRHAGARCSLTACRAESWSRVFVENIAGGNGIIASMNVVRAAPDGYTVLITANTTHACNQSTAEKSALRRDGRLRADDKLGTITLALVANPSVPANDVAELIAYAKANPGKLTFGSRFDRPRACRCASCSRRWPGLTSCTCLTRATRRSVTDLLGGQISTLLRRRFDGLATGARRQAQGLRGFRLQCARRWRRICRRSMKPELKGYDLTAWFAAYAFRRKRRSRSSTKLNAAFREALNDKDVARKSYLAAGIEPEASTPDELKSIRQAAETQKWKKIAADAKIEPE